MPEQAVRSLLNEGGGWERLKGELETGTGLGANMAPAERRALMDRFESHREMVARNAGSVFGGEVVVSDSATGGRDIEVRFTGPDGPQHLTQAQEYLDAKSPGWSEQTNVKLTAPPAPESSRSPRTERVVQALEYRLTDAARSLAGGFVPIYERWGALRTPGSPLRGHAGRRQQAAGGGRCAAVDAELPPPAPAGEFRRPGVQGLGAEHQPRPAVPS